VAKEAKPDASVGSRRDREVFRQGHTTTS